MCQSSHEGAWQCRLAVTCGKATSTMRGLPLTPLSTTRTAAWSTSAVLSAAACRLLGWGSHDAKGVSAKGATGVMGCMCNVLRVLRGHCSGMQLQVKLQASALPG